MAFGVYVHIPYCLQRCVYCDFATYEAHQILPPSEYVARVKKEIALKSQAVYSSPEQREINTIYFGGGTPSLIEPDLLLEIVVSLKQAGFQIAPNAELTLEINPATLNEKKIEKLVAGGFNRFSVGAQSFDDKLLKIAHRKHSAQDTRDTLSLLKKLGVNYSLDILFSLPTQTTDGLKRDLDEALKFDPPHVSPYCLTVPESNPMAKNRACEDDQIEMFELISSELSAAGIKRYEISNFAKPGFESRHNKIYWEDEPYWGIGLSSHSYLKSGQWGVRFWNPRSIGDYISEIDGLKKGEWSQHLLTEKNSEHLRRNQALTDYFHTALRTQRGLEGEKFKLKFKTDVLDVAKLELGELVNRGLLESNGSDFSLTDKGILISNHVFEKLTFLAPSA